MNELRSVACWLENANFGSPSEACLGKSALAHREEAEAAFNAWCMTLPESLREDVSEHAIDLCANYAGEAYHRGFQQGARLILQLLMEDGRK